MTQLRDVESMVNLDKGDNKIKKIQSRVKVFKVIEISGKFVQTYEFNINKLLSFTLRERLFDKSCYKYK